MNVVSPQGIDRNQKNARMRYLLRFLLVRGAGTSSQTAAKKDEKDPHGNERITVRLFQN